MPFNGWLYSEYVSDVIKRQCWVDMGKSKLSNGQEMVQSETNCHSKNQGGEKLN